MASKTYTTKQGDTWDNIALLVYGEEVYADYLMQSNYEYLDILIFSSGTVLNTPDLPEVDEDGLQEWRTEDDSDEDPYDDYDGEEDS